MSTQTFDKELGWVPAIPEPYWVRRWFRWKPHCRRCKKTFADRTEWSNHYVLKHLQDDEKRLAGGNERQG